MKKFISFFVLLLLALPALAPASLFADHVVGHSSGAATGNASGQGTGNPSGAPIGSPSGQGTGNPSGSPIGYPADNDTLPGLPNPLKANSLVELFKMIVNAVLSISYVVVAFFLILSGFKFVTAQGSEDKLKDAKNTFKNTIIGALIVVGAQTIAAVLENVFSKLQV